LSLEFTFLPQELGGTWSLHKDGDDTSVKLPPKIDGNSHQRLLNFDTCSFTKLKNNNNFLKKLKTFKLFIKKKIGCHRDGLGVASHHHGTLGVV
jgi:hypothetical protein